MTIAECARMWIIDTYSHLHSQAAKNAAISNGQSKNAQTHARTNTNPKVFFTRVVDRILFLSIRCCCCCFFGDKNEDSADLRLCCCCRCRCFGLSGKSIGMSEWRKRRRKQECSVSNNGRNNNKETAKLRAHRARQWSPIHKNSIHLFAAKC